MANVELQDLEFEFVFDDLEPASGDGVSFDQITKAISSCGAFADIMLGIAHTDDDLRVPGLVLERVSYASPLTVTGVFKYVSAAVATRLSWLFDTVLTRTVYSDLERQRRIVDIRSSLADVRRKDIENTRALLDLLRDHDIHLGMQDTAKLIESIHTFQYPTTRLDSHRIRPAIGGAAVSVDEPSQKPT